MTMRVNGPNGIVVNFPDGTDAQTVDKVMREATGSAGQPAHHDWSELPGNLGPSALNAGKNYLHVLNPMNYPETVSGMYHLGAGALGNAYNDIVSSPMLTINGKEQIPAIGKQYAMTPGPNMELADKVGQFYKDRYGGAENIKNTIITDPVGAGIDAGTVLSMGAGLVGRGPMIANRAINSVQQLQKMPRAAEKLLRRAVPKSTQSPMFIGPPKPTALDKLGNDAMLLDASPSMTWSQSPARIATTLLPRSQPAMRAAATDCSTAPRTPLDDCVIRRP